MPPQWAFTCPWCTRIFLGQGPVPPHVSWTSAQTCPGTGEEVLPVDCGPLEEEPRAKSQPF